MCSSREIELEDRQSRLEAQLRERIASEGNKILVCDSTLTTIPCLAGSPNKNGQLSTEGLISGQ